VVKRLIQRAVDAAIRQVESVVDYGFDVVDSTIDTVRGSLDQGWDWIRRAAADVEHIVTHDIPAAAAWVENTAHQWVDQLWAGVHALADDAWSWVQSAVHDVESAADWVQVHLIDPLWSWVDQAEAWWDHLIASWWDVIYQSVIAPIVSDLDTAYHWADELWDWYVNIARDVVTVCVKAFGWLVWFAEHPFTALEDAGRELASTFSLRTIEQYVGDAEHLSDQWAEDFARMIS